MKNMRRILLTVLMLVMALSLTGCKGSKYKDALELYNSGEYEAAAAAFAELGDYKESAAMAEKCSDIVAVRAKLSEIQTWFYGNESVGAALNKIVFAGNQATITQYSFSGNGRAETTATPVEFTIDSSAVTVGELVIPYTYDGETLTLDKGFFTIPEIEKGIQGHWKDRQSDYILGMLCVNEHHIRFESGKVTSENAAKSGVEGYDYFYYGPYSSTYTITSEGLETELHGGKEWGFAIYDGKVVVMRYDNVMTRMETDAFPGKDGYSF